MDWELDRALLLDQRELDYLHIMQAMNTHMHISAQQTDNDCAFHSNSDALETLTGTRHSRFSILIFQSKEENNAISPLNGCFTECFCTLQGTATVEYVHRN